LPGVTNAEWATTRPAGAPAAPPPWLLAMMGQGKAKAGNAKAESTPTPSTALLAADEPMLRLYAERGGELAVKAAQIILDAGLELSDLHLANPSLEDVFIHLTGKGLRD
jgi:hypothetical protein